MIIKRKYFMFGKEHTAMTKGILIILMLIHHTLADDLISRYNVQTLIEDRRLANDIVIFCKICIAGFAFLSAYGMTCKLKKIMSKFYFKFLCIQFIKLEFTIVFVYILAILYKKFVIRESIRTFYDRGNGFDPIYMFIDAIGMSTYFKTPQINVTWWYLYFAFLLIITMPFLYILYEKFRHLLLPAFIFLPMAVSSLEVRAGVQSNYAMLLPGVMLGIAFAYEEWFEKLRSYKEQNSFILGG